MKIKWMICLILTSCCLHSTAQQLYVSEYTPFPDSGFIPETKLVNCLDGTYMGITAFSYDSTLSIIKINEEGEALYGKVIHLPFKSAAHDVDVLSDTTIICLLVRPFNSIYTNILLKFDKNGTLLWAKDYSTPVGASFYDIAPATDGGIMMVGGGCAGSEVMIHLDGNGSIISQNYHENHQDPLYAFIHGLIHKGNNQYACWAKCVLDVNTSVSSTLFFTADGTTGISNLVIFPDLLSSYSQAMTAASGGGYYCMAQLNVDSVGDPSKTALLYFNDASQFLWCKIIFSFGIQSAPELLVATPDNGCILTVRNVFETVPLIRLPAFMKFDSLGNLEWTKMLGDTSDSDWSRLFVASTVRGSDNTWMSSFNNKGHGYFARTDSEMNGFCNYSPFSVTVVDSIPEMFTHSLQTHAVSFDVVDVPVNVSPLTLYRQTSCTSTGIEPEETNHKDISIFPNPVTNQLIINGYTPFSVRLFNTSGQTMIEAKNSNNIRLGNLPRGLYLLHLSDEKGDIIKVEKIVKN